MEKYTRKPKQWLSVLNNDTHDLLWNESENFLKEIEGTYVDICEKQNDRVRVSVKTTYVVEFKKDVLKI